MRTSITNTVAALKRRKEENGESGFSLIELIVVVVILGILAAIAVPVFLNLQANAETNARQTVAANAATQIAAGLAASPRVVDSGTGDTLTNLGNAGQFTFVVDDPSLIGEYCVTVTQATGATGTATSGPGC